MGLTVLYLFISCELDRSLWGDFKNIDSVAPPQWQRSPFFDHVLKTVQCVLFNAEGTMNLVKQDINAWYQDDGQSWTILIH